MEEAAVPARVIRVMMALAEVEAVEAVVHVIRLLEAVVGQNLKQPEVASHDISRT